MSDAMNEAWVEVLPDFSRFAKESERGIVDHLGAAGDRGSRRMGNTLVAGIGKFALPIAGAIAALGIGNLLADAVRTGIDQVAQAVVIGSDLNESVNALNVSFGAASEGVQALGRNASESLGVSNREFNSLAVRFESFASDIVGEGGDVVGFIDKLTTRGADFASVYNLDVAQALDLFRSGLAGESEPLGAFGLKLQEAEIRAVAYKNGIAEVGAELTQSEKIQARYLAIMEQTAKVEGDFADTSGELANQQRILAGSFEDAQGRLGEQLLPALTDLISLANSELMPILNDVVDEVGPILADALSQTVPLAKDLVEAFAPLIPDLARLAADSLPPLIEVMILLAPLMVDAAENTRSWFVLLDGLLGLLSGDMTVEEWRVQLQTLGGTFGEVVKWLGNVGFAFNDFQAGVGEAIGGVVDSIGVGIGQAVSFLASLPGRALEAVGNIGAVLRNSGRALIQGFLDGVQSMLRSVGDTFGGLMDFVRGFFPNSPAERGPFSGSGWTDFPNSAQALIDQWQSGLYPVEVPLEAVAPSLTTATATAMSERASQPLRGLTASGESVMVTLSPESVRAIADATLTAQRMTAWSGADA